MTDTKKMSMSELIVAHNDLADKLGIAHETAFKNLAAARDAVANLESKINTVTNTTGPDESAPFDAPADPAGSITTSVVHSTEDKSKYNSSGKRGPTQGVGEYAKSLILEGKDNATVLAEVMVKFPTAKTSKGCIAFYRTALSKGPAVPATPDPAALRAQAQALLDKAAAADTAIADAAAAKAAADAAVAAGAATTPAAEPALV